MSSYKCTSCDPCFVLIRMVKKHEARKVQNALMHFIYCQLFPETVGLMVYMSKLITVQDYDVEKILISHIFSLR